MSSALSQVGDFWEHLRHPFDWKRDDLKISLHNQKGKILIQSLFCGALATLFASLNKTKPLTKTGKIGFVLLALSVTGASFLLLTLACKTRRIYTEMNRLSEIKKEEERIKALLKEKQEAMEQVAKICDEELDPSEETAACEQVTKLIQVYHLNINTVFEWNKDKEATFLSIASEYDSPKMILQLLDLGADPTHRDSKGFNCLHNVILNMTENSLPIIDVMLKRFPDLINIPTDSKTILEGTTLIIKSGYSPLHLAISLLDQDNPKSQMTELLEKLLQSGADINATANDGMTPLDDVFCHGKSEFIKSLLIPELKIDKCLNQGDHIIFRIIEHSLFKDSILMNKLLELQGWSFSAQQRLINFASEQVEEELLQIISEKWGIKIINRD